ncbi:MAG TPA: ATP-binding protein [Acidimicrobiia bacterium]|nr:ATP-binding protein [Acidimicrobiia bacterium]
MNQPDRRLSLTLLLAYSLTFSLTLAAVVAGAGTGQLVGVVGAGVIGAGLVFAIGRGFEHRVETRSELLAGEVNTARAVADRAEEDRRLLEQVLAVVRQGVVLVGEDDVIAYTNPAANELIRPSDRLSSLVPHGLQTLVRQARVEQSVTEGDLEYGSPVRMLRAAAVLFPADKRVLLTITDVTTSNRMEAIRRDFVAAASHELKTPVASIIASTEALGLALAHDPASAERFATQVERSARQLAKLVSDLLDLSRVESSTMEAESVDVGQMVEAEVARARAVAAGVEVDLSVEGDRVAVMGSRPDLALAVRNLLDNALRHTSRGGSISVTVSASNGRCHITVADTGEGIPRRELPRIFERFYRVDSARSRTTGGTGLGLAIVKHVVEGHRGEVSVESELGVGSRFRIDLPA